jgi:hypothetical protein
VIDVFAWSHTYERLDPLARTEKWRFGRFGRDGRVWHSKVDVFLYPRHGNATT